MTDQADSLPPQWGRVSPVKESLSTPHTAGRRRRATSDKRREYCAENRSFELRRYICDLHLSLHIALPISKHNLI
jgi:hypothetical protein